MIVEAAIAAAIAVAAPSFEEYRQGFLEAFPTQEGFCSESAEVYIEGVVKKMDGTPEFRLENKLRADLEEGMPEGPLYRNFADYWVRAYLLPYSVYKERGKGTVGQAGQEFYDNCMDGDAYEALASGQHVIFRIKPRSAEIVEMGSRAHLGPVVTKQPPAVSEDDLSFLESADITVTEEEERAFCEFFADTGRQMVESYYSGASVYQVQRNVEESVDSAVLRSLLVEVVPEVYETLPRSLPDGELEVVIRILGDGLLKMCYDDDLAMSTAKKEALRLREKFK